MGINIIHKKNLLTKLFCGSIVVKSAMLKLLSLFCIIAAFKALTLEQAAHISQFYLQLDTEYFVVVTNFSNILQQAVSDVCVFEPTELCRYNKETAQSPAEKTSCLKATRSTIFDLLK